MRVPIRNTGADHLVVAMKVGNTSGAKGVNYSAGFRDEDFTAAYTCFIVLKAQKSHQNKHGCRSFERW